MNQEIGIRTKFPFKLFHLTKSYDDILSDNEYLSRIRNLLSDINDRYPEFDLSYGEIFHSAYLICGLLTHPVYIQASFDEEFISYDMFEEIEKSLSIHPIDMPFVRCVVYLLLSRMDNPIRGTAYLVDELERELKKEIHIIERPYRYDRNRTREYHLNLTGILKEFNREYIKKYNFDFGVEPASSTLWNVEDIGFLMDISITPRELTIDFIYRFISYWPSLPERIKILNKIQAHFLDKDYLKPYDEEEINEVVEIVHCVIDGTLDRLKDEKKGKNCEVEQSKNKLKQGPYIDIHDNEVVNLSLNKAEVMVTGKNIRIAKTMNSPTEFFMTEEEKDVEEVKDENLTTEKLNTTSKKGGRKPEELFIDGKTQEHADIFVRFLRNHNRSSEEIDTSRKNFVNRAFVSFYHQWGKKGIVPKQPNGNACYRFLKNQCNLSFQVDIKTYGTFIKNLINDEKVDLTDMELRIESFSI